ncbi:MAG TPA: class I SAM-dependent rRNA methyltransferase [Candidatus Binataceae bacterium]|nr:class I SAM-dependent rRNA methyltransferase [Candidatus Binataceae bacterium]
MEKIFLKPGRDATVRGGNPWIFSGAIQRTEPGNLAAGAPVEVHDASGALIGVGYFNPATTIAVRMMAWGVAPPVEEILKHRLNGALALRRQVVRDDTDCYRLVNGDGDGFSGIVIDRYADVLVMQFLTAGADQMRDAIVANLKELLRPRAIIERSSGAVRKAEGLEDREGVLFGEPIAQTEARENGSRIVVDFEHGQKTGYFLDQRENRATFGAMCRGARVLDAYCYAGGFALAALRGGASQVVAVDTSARAIGWAKRNFELNECAANAELVHADAALYLRETKQRFDVIALDPPALARSRKDADRAGHLYVELNALAMRALAPGGRIMTFSCSTHFRGEAFVNAVRIAQTKSKRNLRILAHLGPGPDHPTLLGHVEGEYLTGLLLADLESKAASE